MSALALVLALRMATGDASPAPAAALEVDEVTTASLELVDGTHRDVAGGAWMPDSTLVASGKELAQLRAEKATWDAAPPPVGVSVAVAVVIGVIAFGAGAAVVAITRR